jgi:predicted transcriptional regulator
MTLTIEISTEVERRLETEAKRNGISKTDLAKTVIEERFAPREKRQNYMPPGFKPRYIGKAETRDFSGDHEWLRENREKYQGKYVATHGNRLIASGERLKEVAEKARQEGFPDALLKFIEPLDTSPYIGGVW